jgi:molybdenum cofactor cytidylyltransferase
VIQIPINFKEALMQTRCSAVLLAAGASRRMGCIKQLLPLGGKPFIHHCLATLTASGIEDTVVVLGGPKGAEIEKALHGFDVRVVFNPRGGESEMADSIRVGVRAISKSSSAALICLSDHPLVAPETITSLVHTHSKCPDKILIPAFEGKGGHPTLFPVTILEELHSGMNLKQIVRADPSRVFSIPFSDEGVIIDIDDMEDYRRACTKILDE